MLLGCGEQFPLLLWNDVRNNNDHTGVERFFAVKVKEVGAVVRDERVLPLADYAHKLPIFQAAEAVVTDMVRAVARRMDDRDKGCVKAFVNQKLHVGVAVLRR